MTAILIRGGFFLDKLWFLIYCDDLKDDDHHHWHKIDDNTYHHHGYSTQPSQMIMMTEARDASASRASGVFYILFYIFY
jgi:hypothetical protein